MPLTCSLQIRREKEGKSLASAAAFSVPVLETGLNTSQISDLVSGSRNTFNLRRKHKRPFAREQSSLKGLLKNDTA